MAYSHARQASFFTNLLNEAVDGPVAHGRVADLGHAGPERGVRQLRELFHHNLLGAALVRRREDVVEDRDVFGAVGLRRAPPGLAVAERPRPRRRGGERYHEPPEHNAQIWSAQRFGLDVTGAPAVTPSAPESDGLATPGWFYLHPKISLIDL